MGRHVKNVKPKSGSYSIVIPNGTSTIGPAYPEGGQMRYNSSVETMEFWNGSQWHALAHQGAVEIVRDDFTGDNSTQVFGPMSYNYDAGEENRVIVVVNNVIQNPASAYEFFGNSSIRFSSTPTTSASIYLLHNFSSTEAE